MIVGTRDSPLAMAQTGMFIHSFSGLFPDMRIEVRAVKTSGDIDTTSEIRDLPGYGAFVRELDNALLDHTIDVSVNSMKDVPVLDNYDVAVPSVLPRASPEDVVIPVPLNRLPEGAVVGTSSVRRAAALSHMRPDLEARPLRGNVQTRLSKLDSGEYDAIILAKAGLERVGVEVPMHSLPVEYFTPAPAQGAIAIACRNIDSATKGMLVALNDEVTFMEVSAERKIMRMLGAGCSSPVGIYARTVDGGMRIMATSYSCGSRSHVDTVIPKDHSEEHLRKIADALEADR